MPSRMRATLAFLITVPLLVGFTPSSSIRLNENGPAINPDRINILAPSVLGDALLAPSHPIVTEATISSGKEGLPTPPGMPVEAEVNLYFQPVRSSRWTGFCERKIANIHLKAVYRLLDAAIPASRPESLSTQVAYRWVGGEPNTTTCAAGKSWFFIPRTGEEQQAITSIRLLAEASQEAKQGASLHFPLSFQDKERSSTIKDAREALASLPIGDITFAGLAETTYPDVLLASDMIDANGHHLQAMTIFLGNDWIAALVTSDHQIIRLRLLREIPAPF